ncbi:hypothetical protein HAPAU_26000 [Halalkalicoccus paucihalophilus]|uniref:Uncharacterized protein n=1 Tax=Halalkalicoccus paucihalophilus TaxID=1008153 RepID=A0A151AEE9_9EURY|nr:hypothetical protein [Halalkalicoccus paucihalophilus]KYH25922.1 hypothetical protein HAPAU_26000 [Halalkalicoccus paucihalophilus]
MNETARTETDALNWVFPFLTLLLAGINPYLGVFAPFVPVDRAIQFIALALLVGPVLYFTPYWRPIPTSSG